MNEYEMIRDILDKSSYTVAMCGTDMMKESGMPSLRAPEIAYQVDGGGVGRPFAEHPSPRRLMQPEIQITRGEVRQRLRAPGQLLLHVTGIFIPAPNSLRIGAQIRV